MLSAAIADASRRNQIPRGIVYMVISTVMFAGVNAIVKWELAPYPIGEVAFYRALFALVDGRGDRSCRAPGSRCCAPAATARICSAGCRSSAR